MPPDVAATAEIHYGIIKDPDVKGFMSGLPILVRERLQDAIDTLETNPRPAGSETREIGGMSTTRLVVSMEQPPPYLLVYYINDQKQHVYVIAISEKRFS